MTRAEIEWRERFAPGRLWSLWDMLEVDGKQFLSALTELANAKSYIRTAAANEASEPLYPSTSDHIIRLVDAMMSPIFSIGSKSAWVSAERFKQRLANRDPTLTFGAAGDCLADIESRFVDHLGFIKMYVVADDRTYLLQGAELLANKVAADRFTSARFDLEEAAKCLCLSRATASVFHSMRVLEVAIKALAKHLGIPDPTRPAERNWGVILRAIRTAIDEQFPASTRLPGSKGSTLETIYANLDATKNPWRNATMHVEAVYTLDEAQHIFNCTKALLNKMADVFDENGLEAPPPPLPALSSLIGIGGGLVEPTHALSTPNSAESK